MAIIDLVNSLGHALFKWRGTKGGAGYVADVGLGAQQHNRNVSGITETTIKTILLPTGVYAVRFRLSGGSNGDLCRVVFDASPIDDAIDTTQANAWLTTAGDATTDQEYRTFSQRDTTSDNDGFSDWFTFDASSEGVRRIDFLADTTNTFSLEMETA